MIRYFQERYVLKSKTASQCFCLLTGVSPGTERTLSAPGHAVQAAAFRVRGSFLLVGIRAHVVLLQALPANVHVYVLVRL